MILVASIGLNSFAEDKLKKIILSGADILRYNFSHRTMEDKIEYIKSAKKVIEDLNSSVKILIDMPMNKIRLGDFNDKLFSVREGEEVVFKSAPYTNDCNEFIPVETSKLGEKTYQDQTITIGDGEIAIQVIEIINRDTIKARILNNGIIKYFKTFNTEDRLSEEELLKHYEKILDQVYPFKPEYLAISYINKDTNEKIKNIINEKGHKSKIIIKIEKQIEQKELEEICQEKFYDMVMIDRGELGVNVPYEKTGIFQKIITKIANKHKKTVIVSTQILESTVNNYIPSRSDISNLTNMILDGVDGIVFCHETTIGARPSYTISVAKKIINEAEKQKTNYDAQHHNTQLTTLFN